LAQQLAVVSVPHTGTVFTCDLLSDLKPSAWHLTDDGIRVCFSFEGKMVVPLRKPEHVMWTWEKRGRDKKQFIWDQMWLSLLLLATFPRVHFFFIEEDREVELSRLSVFLETELNTDWTPKNTEGAPGACEWDGGLSSRVYEWLLLNKS
jgi:hypothetical protein